MSHEHRYVDPAGAFEITLPAGWEADPDPEEEGVEFVGPEEVGVLHLMAFPQPEEMSADPADELYAFLAEEGIEIEEDEVDDLELHGGAEMALCEFVHEGDEPGEEAGDDEEDEPAFWLVGVATAPGWLVFVTYICPVGEEETERAAVRAALATLRPLTAA